MLSRLILASLLALPFLSNAQNTVTGYVLDSLQNPVGSAVVRMTTTGGNSFTTLTGNDGLFLFSNIATGNYRIKISCTGYKTYQLDTLAVPVTTVLKINLQTDELTMKTVVVTSRKPVIQQLTDMTVMNVDARLLSETSTGLDILKLAPGVTIGDNEDEISLSGKDAVQLMLNGKLVHLSVRDLLKLLKANPANTIFKIDIVTNPSSKYDVKGNTGILNIWMKKTGNAGLTENINASISSGKFQMGDLSANSTYGTNKLGLQSYLAFHFGKYQSALDEKRLTPGFATQTKNSNDIDQWRDPVWRLQADYAFNAKHTIGALIEMEKSSNKGYYNAGIVSNYTNGDTIFHANNNSTSTRKWNTYNLNYQFKDTNNHQLNIDLDRSYYNKDMNTSLNNSINAASFAKILAGGFNTTNTTIDILTAKSDYAAIMSSSKIKIETGIKISHVAIKNAYHVERIEGSLVKIDSMLTSNFDYKENVQSVYGNIGKNYKKWGWQIGLRMERSVVAGVSKDLYAKQTDRPDTSYFNLLPSIFIRYTPVADHSFRLSFTRRIARPDYEDLRPFQYYQDLFFVQQGNPALAPQINYNTEFTYSLKSKTTFIASYNYTTNYFTEVNFAAGPVVYQTVKNAGKTKDFTLSVNRPQKICKWWNSTYKAAIFHNEFSGQVFNDYIHTGKWGFNASTSQRFSLPHEWMISLTARYNSPFRRLIYSIKSSAAIGLSINKNLKNDKGNIRLGMSDIFNMQKKDIIVNTSSLHCIQYNRWESRRIFIDLSINLSNKKKAEVRDRETGNSDERQRSGN